MRGKLCPSLAKLCPSLESFTLSFGLLRRKQGFIGGFHASQFHSAGCFWCQCNRHRPSRRRASPRLRSKSALPCTKALPWLSRFPRTARCWRWTCRAASMFCPSAGGPAKRVTDIFNDARQPQWSPDGKNIVFFGYRDGGYDLWEVGADGSNQHMLTEGTFDDREPIFSHDGSRIAFSSDRGNPLGQRQQYLGPGRQDRGAARADQGSVGRRDAGLVGRRQGNHFHLQPRQLQERMGGECRHRRRAQGGQFGRQDRGRVGRSGRPAGL